MTTDKKDNQENPFSEKLLGTYRRIQTASSQNERTQAMMEFAGTFASEHDHTDHTANENYHEFIEEYEIAKLDFEHAAMKLARMGVDLIEHTMASDEAPANDDEVQPKVAPVLGRRLN